MKKKLLVVLVMLSEVGIDVRRFLKGILWLPYVLSQYIYVRRTVNKSMHFSRVCFYPCLHDRSGESGSASGHYFHQDFMVARKVYEAKPKRHIDVGSRLDGFVAHVAIFRRIEVIDIRPQDSKVFNIKFIQQDLMGSLADQLEECCDSLSCLHALEHFGLGRYGDPLNLDGYMLGFSNLHSMLKLGGKMYFSVPIGPRRIEFNAHRVFDIELLMKIFQGKFEINSFSYVDDSGNFFEDAELSDESVSDNFGCNYGCGIFELTKII